MKPIKLGGKIKKQHHSRSLWYIIRGQVKVEIIGVFCSDEIQVYSIKGLTLFIGTFARACAHGWPVLGPNFKDFLLLALQ
jgi:hypothetical protein